MTDFVHTLGKLSLKDQTVGICAGLNILAGLAFGYLQCGGIAAATETLWRCWYHLSADTERNAFRISALFSTVTVSYIPATLFAGPMMDKWGRRRVLAMAALLSSLSVLGSMLSYRYSLQIASRLATGAAMGILTSTCPVYISEMTPAEHRGVVGTLFQVATALGIFLGNVQGYLVLGPARELMAWAYCSDVPHLVRKLVLLFAPGLLASLCLFGLASLVMPESTEWLERQHQEDTEATEESALKSDASAPSPQPILTTASTTSEDVEAALLLHRSSQEGWLGLLYFPKALVTGFAMAMAFMLTGISAVMWYAPTFLDLAGVKHRMGGSMLLMGWNFVTTLVSLGLADRYSRREVLLPALLSMSLAVSLMPFAYGVMAGTPFSAPASFVLLFAFIAGFELGPGTLFWVICNEITPPELAARAFSLINASQGVLSLLVTLLFPPLERQLGSASLYFFGIPGLLVWVYLFLCLPETRGRSKREITRGMAGRRWILYSPF